MKIKCVNSCDPYDIELDLVETILVVRNNFLKNVSLLGQYGACEECDLQPLCGVPRNTTNCVIVDTRFSLQMEASDGLSYKCSWDRSFMQHYQYDWELSRSCYRFHTKKVASHPYLPIVFFLLGILILVTTWIIANWLYDKLEGCFERAKSKKNIVGAIDVFNMDKRVVAVDVFRGMCVVLMIFINYGGGQYWFFQPSVSDFARPKQGPDFVFLNCPSQNKFCTLVKGALKCCLDFMPRRSDYINYCSPTDYRFLWLSGFSMSISFQKKLIRGVSRVNLLKQAIIRSVIIFTIGLLLNSHSHGDSSISKMRVFGVLQRIGITYFLVGIVEIVLMKRKYKITEACFLEDLHSSWPEWLIIVSISTLHSVITFCVNVSGCGRGYVGPGGLHKHGQYSNCTGGIAGYIDRKILDDHIFQHSSHRMIYETDLDFDSEGFLGTLSSSLMIMLGVQAGRVLHMNTDLYQRAARWGFLGSAFCLLGGGLCGFSRSSGLIPLNSKLWSISFVYTMSGLAFFIFAVLFILIDGRMTWRGLPFHYPGMNPLLLYILHDLFKNAFPFKWEPKFNTHAEHFSMNVLGAIIWMAFSIYLHKKKLYVSI